MTNTGSFERIIVEKNRRYVRSGKGTGSAEGWKPDWTPHVWDAKQYKSADRARKDARKVDGRVRVFDTLNGRFLV